MIVQNEAADGRADLSFTVFRDDLPGTLRAVDEAVKELGAEGYNYDENVSKISVVGLGMATRPGVAGTMFRALAEKGINIQMITTSEIKISAVVAREFAQEALRAVHEAFGLQQPPACEGRPATAPRPPKPNSEKTGGTPATHGEADHRRDRPGRVAGPGHIRRYARHPRLGGPNLRHFAEAGIVVDMIVQSIGRDNRADISVTVPEGRLKKAIHVAEERRAMLGCDRPTHCPQVAKLSVFGVGMKSHTGVAVAHVPVAGQGGNQRRVDKLQRSAIERHRRRPGRPKGIESPENRTRRRDGIVPFLMSPLPLGEG